MTGGDARFGAGGAARGLAARCGALTAGAVVAGLAGIVGPVEAALPAPVAAVTAGASASGGDAVAGGRRGAGTAPQEPGCRLCHGDLELLRQQAPDMDRAREIHVALPSFRSSAHGAMRCAECHDGFGSFPHPDRGTSTTACASCHEDVESAWTRGAHAPGVEGRPPGSGGPEGPATGAPCVDCHSVHEVETTDRLREADGVRLMNRRCVECHAAARLPPSAPHADSVACHACHRPHDVGYVGTPAAATSGGRQAETCGACHGDVASSWTEDVHGSAVAQEAGDEGRPTDAPDGRGGVDEGGEDGEDPPLCTTCHGAHGMAELASGARPGADASRCDDCHEDYADTFGDSYHGQAVSLGSPAAASCADCHTAHAIYPASNPTSTVAGGNLVETCGECHPDANASFVEFQPHADPHDREKNPILYWSYKFMTWLLVGVMTVFGLHSLLWLARLGVGRMRSGRGGDEGAGSAEEGS